MISFGLIGLGSIGKKHLLNAYSILGNTAKYYVYDSNLNPNSISDIPSERLVVCSSIDALYEETLDICYICTPNFLHFQHALPLVEQGVPVFIEKPITINFHDCVKLINSAKSHIFVGANMRYTKPVIMAKSMIQNGALGTVIGARAYFGHDLSNWRPGTNFRKNYAVKSEFGGGIIWDGIHELDYLVFLFGTGEDLSGFFGNYGVLGIEVEESADLILKHANGICSSIHLDYIQPLKQRGLEIYGSNATFIWNSEGKSPEVMSIKLKSRSENRVFFNDINKDQNLSFLNQMRDVFSVLTNKKELESTNLLTAHKAISEIELIEGLKKSHNEF